MKKFFEGKRKFIFIGAGILFLLAVFAFGGSPKIGFIALQKIQEVKGGTAASSLPEYAVVTKVIDGDTVVVQGGNHIRLLGIDSDEKGYPCFDAARLAMENLVLNKTVRLEKDQEDQDQYKRFLRYIFLGNQNINLEMVKQGLAVARFYPENQKYKAEITAAETAAISNKVGCKWKTSLK